MHALPRERHPRAQRAARAARGGGAATTTHFGGVSPINEQNRALIAALERGARRARHRAARSTSATATGIRCSPTRCAQMTDDGVRRALALRHLGVQLATRAAASTARTSTSRRRRSARTRPSVDKLALLLQPSRLHRGESPTRRPATQIPRERGRGAHVAFTAHSIPVAMAERCALRGAARREPPVWSPRAPATRRAQSSTRAAAARRTSPGSSRTSATTCATSHGRGVTDVVVSPIGFVSDHVEVLYDLDVEAARAGRRARPEPRPRRHARGRTRRSSPRSAS